MQTATKPAKNGHAPAVAVVRLMTEKEARQCVKAIKDHLSEARAKLVELYEREGWRALGYPSWRQCVLSEFEQHQSQLYRLLAAGLVEREISPTGEIGHIPERQLRELTALDDPLLRKAAWEVTQEQEKVTAQIVKQAVKAAADWANEYIASQGHASLEGKSLEVAKAGITERMEENRKRQTQHIIESYERQQGLGNSQKVMADAVVDYVHPNGRVTLFSQPLAKSLKAGQKLKIIVYVVEDKP